MIQNVIKTKAFYWYFNCIQNIKCQKDVKKDQSDIKDNQHYLIFFLDYLKYHLVEIEARRHSEEVRRTIDKPLYTVIIDNQCDY